MAKEIERKFLVKIDEFSPDDQGAAIKQGYIPTQDKTVVRVRVLGDKAFLTLKGENKGISRSEFEYEIPNSDAESMLQELCKGPIIDKTRYTVPHEGHIWEVDIFHGDNDGLVVAEVELEHEDEKVKLPSWVAEEVSGQAKYYNSNLLDKPYNKW